MVEVEQNQAMGQPVDLVVVLADKMMGQELLMQVVLETLQVHLQVKEIMAGMVLRQLHQLVVAAVEQVEVDKLLQVAHKVVLEEAELLRVYQEHQSLVEAVAAVAVKLVVNKVQVAQVGAELQAMVEQEQLEQ